MVPRDIFALFLMLFYIIGTALGQTKMQCPAVRTTSGWLDLFPLPCNKHSECSVMGVNHLCCKGYCTKAVQAAAKIVNDQSLSPSMPSSSTSAPKSVAISSTSPTTTTSSTTSTTTTSTTPSTTSRRTTSTTTTTTTTTTPRPTTKATTVEDLLMPFFRVLPIVSTTTKKPKTSAATKTSTKNSKPSKTVKLVCPKQIPAVLFAVPCENNAQCRVTAGVDTVCCSRRCVRGVKPVPVTTPEPPHSPLLGIIPRECPTEPLGELLFEVQKCKTDADCWPRLCCADGKNKYCKTAKSRLDLVPVASRIEAPVRAVERYLQCTPPPERDLFPLPCQSSVDCFPNLCCAEGGKKFCRPPMRSFLSLIAGVGQRIG